MASPLDAFVEPHEAADVVLELVRLYRDHGPREARAISRYMVVYVTDILST